MRLQFKKGLTPERMADVFIKYVRDNDLVVGTVNIYIQTYDEKMKPERFNRGDSFMVFEPLEKAKEEYEEDVVKIRRSRITRVI